MAESRPPAGDSEEETQEKNLSEISEKTSPSWIMVNTV